MEGARESVERTQKLTDITRTAAVPPASLLNDILPIGMPSLPSPALTLAPIRLSAFDSIDDPSYSAWIASTVSQSLSLLKTLPTSGSSPSSSPLWKPRKLYHPSTCPTQTWSSFKGKKLEGAGETEGYRWHARRTKCGREQGTFEEFREGLLRDHTVHEAQYIEAVKEFKQVKEVKKGEFEVWQTKYNNSPASPREFVFAVLTIDTTPSPPSNAPLRSFIVVSIPVAAPEEKGYVRGRYVSVEHCQETEDGEVLWTMVVSSDAGGWVPKMMSEMVMPAKIAEDVPSFLEWIKRRRA